MNAARGIASAIAGSISTNLVRATDARRAALLLSYAASQERAADCGGQSLQDCHQTDTSLLLKTKKSAGANLLTLVYLGSPTWARTRDLRINSPALYQLSYRGTTTDYNWLSLGLRHPPSPTAATCVVRGGTSRHGGTGTGLGAMRAARSMRVSPGILALFPGSAVCQPSRATLACSSRPATLGRPQLA